MSTVTEITPKERGLKVRTDRALKPFAHGVEEFFESLFENFPGRWMGSFKDPFHANLPLWPEFVDVKEGGFPRIDMIDREKDLFVCVELPGVRKEDLEISILGDRLIIQGTREYKDEKKDAIFFRSEMGYGKVSRTVLLPVEVDTDQAKAELKDGMLELKLPKVQIHTRHFIKVA